jgi:trehalose synthase
MKKYKKRDIKIPQVIIPPAIDPLSLKNQPMRTQKAKRLLSINGIDPDVPIICQVSRFDKWKDPIGVINIFKKVKKKCPKCQLVMIGDASVDDPEGTKIYSKVLEEVKGNKDIHIIAEKADLLVNALQRQSKIVLQNSKKEGFALTISEALWKGTPVVATAVGGIPLQVKNGKTGFLIKNTNEGAKRCIQLLEDAKLRGRLGHQGKEHVKKNFLITKHLENYLDLYNEVVEERKR